MGGVWFDAGESTALGGIWGGMLLGRWADVMLYLARRLGRYVMDVACVVDQALSLLL